MLTKLFSFRQKSCIDNSFICVKLNKTNEGGQYVPSAQIHFFFEKTVYFINTRRRFFIHAVTKPRQRKFQHNMARLAHAMDISLEFR